MRACDRTKGLPAYDILGHGANTGGECTAIGQRDGAYGLRISPFHNSACPVGNHRNTGRQRFRANHSESFGHDPGHEDRATLRKQSRQGRAIEPAKEVNPIRDL